jgi:hypothetical protein
LGGADRGGQDVAGEWRQDVHERRARRADTPPVPARTSAAEARRETHAPLTSRHRRPLRGGPRQRADARSFDDAHGRATARARPRACERGPADGTVTGGGRATAKTMRHLARSSVRHGTVRHRPVQGPRQVPYRSTASERVNPTQSPWSQYSNRLFLPDFRNPRKLLSLFLRVWEWSPSPTPVISASRSSQRSDPRGSPRTSGQASSGRLVAAGRAGWQPAGVPVRSPSGRRASARRSNRLLETNRSGVFAVGDVRGGNIKRVASAVGEGSIAVAFVHQVLHQ